MVVSWIVVQKPATHRISRRSTNICPGCSISGPSSTRQASVVSEFLPEICSTLPNASTGALAEKYDESHGSREVGASGCARLRPARWHRGGQRNQPRNRATSCADVRSVIFGTMTPPSAHLGRSSHDVSRRKVERITPKAKSCEISRSATKLFNRSWTVSQVCTEARRGRRHRRCLGRVFQGLLSRVSCITMVHSFLLQ